jgi:hypothetical protein
MSTKERDRLKVLHELKQGHLTQGVAALVKRTRWRPDVGYSAGRRSAACNYVRGWLGRERDLRRAAAAASNF